MHTLDICEFFLDSESTKSATSDMSRIALLCFPSCTYSKTRTTSICWWIWFTAWRALYTYIYYFKRPSLRNFQGFPSFPLISPFFTTLTPTMLVRGTGLENPCVLRQGATLVKSRAVEPEHVHPALSRLTLRQAAKLLCASPIKPRKERYLPHEGVLKIKWAHAWKALRKAPGTLQVRQCNAITSLTVATHAVTAVARAIGQYGNAIKSWESN